jgi:hypothetical protein
MQNVFRLTRASFFVPAVLSLIFLWFLLMHFDARRAASNQRASGLAAVAGAYDPYQSAMTYITPSAKPQGGVVGGVPGGIRRDQMGVGGVINGIVSSEPVAEKQLLAYDRQSAAPDQKLIRTVALELVVRDVRAIADQLRHAAESSGGELESVSLEQREVGLQSGEIRLRVPAANLDTALAELKKLAIRVQHEQIDTRDVNREYLDTDSRLRNMRAEEQQYLALLKRAGSMKDTLEVTEKISEVRGEIERLQGELNYMSRQVAMSAISIRLIQESDAQVAGLHWRPLYNAKLAAREMLSGLADWVDFLVALILKLPLILVWFVTAVLLAAMAWKGMRWLWKKFVPARKELEPATQS